MIDRGRLTPTLTDFSYTGIKSLAKRLRRAAKYLIALSPANDPFYIGPARQSGAKWFVKIWQRLNLGEGFHIRRIHYVLISQKRAQPNPLGTPYQNTHEDWVRLINVSRDARLLELVPASFVDRRNAEPI